MKINRFCLTPFLLILGTLLLLGSGCAASKPSRFYLLEPLGASAGAESISPIDQSVGIGLGPVTLPDYLDRPQIVTRNSENRVIIDEFNRWSESLQSSFSRVVAENLSVLLQTDRVALFPWPKAIDVTYQVIIQVHRFDGILGEKSTLEAQWYLVQKKGEKVLASQRSSLSQRMDGASYDALVASQSRLAADLSREIAGAVRKIGR